jgi:hypothetical protein
LFFLSFLATSLCNFPVPCLTFDPTQAVFGSPTNSGLPTSNNDTRYTVSSAPISQRFGVSSPSLFAGRLESGMSLYKFRGQLVFFYILQARFIPVLFRSVCSVDPVLTTCKPSLDCVRFT